MTEQFIQQTSKRHIILGTLTVLGLAGLALGNTLPVAADDAPQMTPIFATATATGIPPVTGIAVPPMPPPVSNPALWKITQEQAIAIASGYLTPETLAQARHYAYQSLWGDGKTTAQHGAWTVVFVGATLTQADLDYKAPAEAKPSPSTPYDTLMVTLDGETGAFISKTASAAMPLPATPPAGTTTCIVNPLPGAPPVQTLPYGEGDKAADAGPVAAPAGGEMTPIAALADAGTPAYLWLMVGTGVLLLVATGGLVALAYARSRRPQD